MKNGKFEVGDRVVVTTKEWGARQKGDKGAVSYVRAEPREPWELPVGVTFDPGSHAHTNSYEHDQLALIKQPAKPTRSIAKDLRLTPQARTVLKHLEHRGRISPSEALITYSISRLASCIHEVRRAGYNVLCIIKKDEHGHKYARYTLIKPSMVN